MNGLAVGTQRYAPKVVFINGEYNGILNARDRKDHKYLADIYGIDGTKTDLLKRNAMVDNGSAAGYTSMLAEWRDSLRSGHDFYKLVNSYIDTQSFIDYFVGSIFFSRTDWPGNNIAYWRYTGSKTELPITDGRWRWLVYDADEAKDVQHPTLLYALGLYDQPRKYPPWASFMLRALLDNPRFKQEFIIRFADLINTSFAPERMLAIIDGM